MKLKKRVAFSGIIICFMCICVFLLDKLPKNLNGYNAISFMVQPRDRNKIFMESDAHISAIRKRLNKSNYTSDDFSPEGGEEVLKFKPAEEEPLTRRNSGETRTLHGNFTDEEVDLMFRKLQHYNGRMFDFDELRLTPYDSLLWNLKKRNRRRGNYLPAYRNYDGSGLANWEKFQKGINQYFMYDPDDPAVDGMVEEMATLPVIDVEQKEGGTQLKLIITFNDEGQALFKPMRFPREQETLPNHFYFSDYERHNAEIAAFHLDRVLGFYRVPPVAGRVFNMTFEIKRFADRKLAKTFFISPANNVCFHGSCSYYCDSGHAICGHPDTVEASLAAFLPPEKMGKRKTWRNPWKRSYSKHRKAYWEVYDDLCDKVRDKPPYNNGRRLQDLIDTHVFDFLQGNLDRHHYETFRDFGNNTFHMHLDNGRGFGKSKADEHTILAPLYQCCVIRYSTFMKLAKLYIGPEKMSILMKKSLLRDRVSPVVLDVHLIALDRRVMKILREVAQCLEKGLDVTEVIVDDFF